MGNAEDAETSLPLAEAYPGWDLTQKVIAAAQEVHRELGSGFLESVYEAALTKELVARRSSVTKQAALEVRYKGDRIGVYYADLLVDGKLICELKAVRALTLEHEIQLFHYLKATGIPLGLLLNFGAPTLQIKRKIYSKEPRPPRSPSASSALDG